MIQTNEVKEKKVEKMNFKFDRRRAISAKLIRESKTHPGYFKYEILIGEKDGTTNLVPSYGKDMMDALERILWKERINNIQNRVDEYPAYFLALTWLLLTIVGPSITFILTSSPLPFLMSLGVNIIIGSIFMFFNNKYTNKF
jgi:hypothetical protein